MPLLSFSEKHLDEENALFTLGDFEYRSGGYLYLLTAKEIDSSDLLKIINELLERYGLKMYLEQTDSCQPTIMIRVIDENKASALLT